MRPNSLFEVYSRADGQYGVRFADKYVTIYGASVQSAISSKDQAEATRLANIYVANAFKFKPLPVEAKLAPAVQQAALF